MTFFKSREPTDLNNSPELDKSTELDKSAESAVEGEIREFVRRDASALRRAPETESEVASNNISTLLQRVADFSVVEIDRLTAELHALRDLLQAESTRVEREITGYARLSQSVLQSTKIISESLAKSKNKNARPG